MITKIIIILLSFICKFQIMEATNLTVTENLALISWDHAVNDQKKLEEALKSDVEMLEADIQIGSLYNQTEVIPIMAHPPSKQSDLSLEQFLSNVSEYNSQNITRQKGIKLDFKSIEAFNASIPILLKRNMNQATYPVWLNADILKGPGQPSSKPVNETEFLSKSKQFTNMTLSIGWTTNYDANTTNATYTQQNIKEMKETLNKNKITQKITFPVRAVYAAESLEEMEDLIANVSDSTLTIWSAETDPVNVENLRQLIKTIGVDKIYVDVPKKLKDQLGLNGTKRLAPLGLLSVALSALLLLHNVLF